MVGMFKLNDDDGEEGDEDLNQSPILENMFEENLSKLKKISLELKNVF